MQLELINVQCMELRAPSGRMFQTLLIHKSNVFDKVEIMSHATTFQFWNIVGAVQFFGTYTIKYFNKLTVVLNLLYYNTLKKFQKNKSRSREI